VSEPSKGNHQMPLPGATQVASGVIDTMKSQPMTLALVIFNLLFATLVFLGSKDFRANQLQLMKMMIELSGESQALLAKCIIPATPPNTLDRRGNLVPPFPVPSFPASLPPLPRLDDFTRQ
jgi:hypothetical protein